MFTDRTMSATKAGKRPLRTLTAHEKLSAIKRVSVGGESKASVARDIGVPESTLRGWCKNQEKISYQVRTSPTNLDDSSENISLVVPTKRIKLDEQPYNLCMKTSEASNGSYSPNSENHFDGEYPKSSETESENSPLNLRTKPDTTTAPITTTPKPTTNQAAIDKEKEREKNRAELARLSAELGLNRPEVFLSTLNSSNNMTDVTSLLIQWNSIYQQHLMYQQQKALQQNKNKVTAPADTSTKVPASNGLLTTVDKRDKMLPNTEQQPSVYDSVSYWLRQQPLMGLNATNTPQSMLNLTSCLPSTSSMTHVTTTTSSTPSNSALLNGMTANQSVNQQLRFWNWYKQSAYNATQMQQVTATQQPHLSPQQPHLSPQQPHLSPQPLQADKQILYQQLTKEANEKDVNSENEVAKEEKPKNGNRNRSVLDNLLLNNNTIDYECQKEAEPLEAYEAIEHGEKFLHWLESCSDPSVTTMQILTLQTLMKNLKTGFDRKNGDCQSKTKVKRK